MIKLSQRTEVVINIIIVAVAFILGGIFVQRHLLAKAGNQNANVSPTIGKSVNLSNGNFTAQSKTIILALQTKCHFCNESMPFYKHLIEAAKGKNIKVVAVFPQSVEEATKHLNQFGLTEIEVRQASFSALDVSGTPTLILANSKGEIINYWVGKLTPDKETEIINQLLS